MKKAVIGPDLEVVVTLRGEAVVLLFIRQVIYSLLRILTCLYNGQTLGFKTHSEKI